MRNGEIPDAKDTYAVALKAEWLVKKLSPIVQGLTSSVSRMPGCLDVPSWQDAQSAPSRQLRRRSHVCQDQKTAPHVAHH